jgi:hypothetical protein
MAEDKSDAVADFLNLVPKDPFEEKEVEAPQEEEAEVEDEKPLPFNQDPKVQRFIEKQVEKRLANFKPEVIRESVKEDDINLPSSFIKLVGNDTDEKKQVLQDLSKYFGNLKGEARQEFLQEMQEQEEQRTQEDNAALAELNSGFEEIEETHNVDLSSNSANAQRTRAAFVDYLKKVSHKNEDGEVDQFADIPAAWEEFSSRQQRSNSVAKKLASRSLGSSQSASETPQGRDYSWKGVEKLFSTLGK